MWNKGIMLPVMALFSMPGLLLTSCKESTGFASPPVSFHRSTTGLLLDGGEKRVSLVANKLRHSSSQRTHIVIIGDSHIAADFFLVSSESSFRTDLVMEESGLSVLWQSRAIAIAMSVLAKLKDGSLRIVVVRKTWILL
ncbi:hypothetical protein [Pantoea vagans]|uniref:hypothetical protein n=1 Tax=Pantoea vagans TaxID=470934 RepID=UPI003FA37FFB